jgi:hypothetical protein
MPNKRQPIFDLDDEEKELSDTFDRGEWKGTKKLKQEVNLAKEAVANYFKKKRK